MILIRKQKFKNKRFMEMRKCETREKRELRNRSDKLFCLLTNNCSKTEEITVIAEQ